MSSLRKSASHFVLWYIRFWAHAALAIHRPTVIGIAGSVGKSSTKEILYAMLKDQAETRYTYGNSETGVPLGILGIDISDSTAINWIKNLLICPFKITNLLKVNYLIVEMGTDEPYPPKNMDYLLTIVQPDIAIHLNAQPVHAQQFAATLTPDQQQLSPQQQQPYIVASIGFEDAKVITKTQANPAIINADDQVLMDLYLPLMATQANKTFLTFGQNQNDQLSYQGYAIAATGTTFTFLINSQLIAVELPGYVLPQHFQQLIGAALLAASSLKIDLVTCAAHLTKNFHLPKGRSTVLPGIKSSAIIDSTYNASAGAVLDMVGLLAALKQQTNRPTVLLLGDMRELGDQAEVEHTKVLQAISGIDYIYAVGPLTKQYVMDPLHQQNDQATNIRWFTDAQQAADYLKDNLPDNALILAKGSQNTIYLEEAVKKLLANPNDASKLCRQEPHWLKTKQAYFSSVKE